jgi:hypothetical protein
VIASEVAGWTHLITNNASGRRREPRYRSSDWNETQLKAFTIGTGLADARVAPTRQRAAGHPIERTVVVVAVPYAATQSCRCPELFTALLRSPDDLGPASAKDEAESIRRVSATMPMRSI